jgi:predicted DNA-binding protein YlxM (UPF0122 family)
MSSLSRYWTIWRIHPSLVKNGYQSNVVMPARQFVKKPPIASSNFTEQEQTLQPALFSYFRGDQSTAARKQTAAEAGLCLRCYVSRPILQACRKLANLFASGQCFTFQELLPFVLNDDGETLVLCTGETKEQLLLNAAGEVQPSAYHLFSVEVLRSYDHISQTSLNLDNWVYLQTKQNTDVRAFLSEYGFQHLSDWALLNRARPAQLERLSHLDQSLVAAFHAVYRRDRRQRQQAGKCPDPSAAQLQEMLLYLQKQSLATPADSSKLLKLLQQVAAQLRNYDVWQARAPLEVYCIDADDYILRPDLPNETHHEYDNEQQELLEFLSQQLAANLPQAIEQELRARMAALQKKRKGTDLLTNFVWGLQLYYQQSLSLREIADRLKMTNWAQARRLIDPGNLLSSIRARVVHQILDRVLEKAKQLGAISDPLEPEYLHNVAQQIEAWVDREVFQAATEEIRTGQHRSMTSFYAHSVLDLLEKLISEMSGFLPLTA